MIEKIEFYIFHPVTVAIFEGLGWDLLLKCNHTGSDWQWLGGYPPTRCGARPFESRLADSNASRQEKEAAVWPREGGNVEKPGCLGEFFKPLPH